MDSPSFVHIHSPLPISSRDHSLPTINTRAPPTASLEPPTRRRFLQLLSLLPLLPALPNPVSAISGLKLFPLSAPLVNRYYFLRAGQSVSDARGVVVTNPVWKLNIDLHGLTKRGVREARSAAASLESFGVGYDAWIWCGTQVSSLETAEVVASSLGVPREQLVPEYAFLDSRGVGELEWGKKEIVEKTVNSVDERGDRSRIELGVDGTPGESVHDVFVRMRQLLSKLETAWQDQDIVVTAPDSYTLAILETALKGEDLTRYTNYSYRTGEVRKVEPTIYLAEEKRPLSLADALAQFNSER